MRHRGVHSHNDVHQLHQGCRVREVLQLVAKMQYVPAGFQRGPIGRAQFLLEAYELRSTRQQLLEFHQRDRAVVIVLVPRAARPCQSDAWQCLDTEPVSPLVDAAWIAAQVRNSGGDVVEARATGEGQAEQRTMTVEFGQGFTFGQQTVDAIQSRQQRLEGTLDFQQHRRAAFRYQFRIPAKLYGISQALLRMEKDGLSGNGFFAQPQWLLEIAPGVALNILPAPLVARPASLKITGAQPA